MESDTKPKKKLSLSAKIMIGMGLGLVAGMFFGEYCGFLEIIGDAFIKLLQMTILPYITVSMILGIGGRHHVHRRIRPPAGLSDQLQCWGDLSDLLGAAHAVGPGDTHGYFSMAVKNIYERDFVIANMQSSVLMLPRKVYTSAEKA